MDNGWKSKKDKNGNVKHFNTKAAEFIVISNQSYVLKYIQSLQ